MDLWDEMSEMKMKEIAVQPTQEYKSTCRLEIKSNKLRVHFWPMSTDVQKKIGWLKVARLCLLVLILVL